jgi:hypothetical protein
VKRLISLYLHTWVLSFAKSGLEDTELRVIITVVSLAAYGLTSWPLILKEEQRLRISGTGCRGRNLDIRGRK